jgi:putative DNA methylase
MFGIESIRNPLLTLRRTKMTDRRLIEVELPLAEINTESAVDKRTHDGHISTLHNWWAGRPLPMSRAMVAAALLPDELDNTEVLGRISESLPTQGVANNGSVTWLRERIAETNPDGVRVLDCFAGRGAIPLEALRLGCDTTAMDLNPVAHLIERACLEYPQRFGVLDESGANTLAGDVRRWAEWVKSETKTQVDHLYPTIDGRQSPAPFYFWVRTMPSPDPGLTAQIPILSSRVLAEKRNAWVELHPESTGVRISVHQAEQLPDDPTLKEGNESAGSVTCPISGITAPQRDTKRFGTEHGFGQRLYAVCDVDGRNRTYREPDPVEVAAEQAAAEEIQAIENDEFPEGVSVIPDEVVDKIGYRNLQFLPYGWTTWRSLFTDRQLVLFTSLSRNIRRAHEAMIGEGMDPDRARAVVTYLAFASNKVADRNSAFSSWATTRETIRGTFPGQTVQMRWDFCENYPFRKGSGSWNDAVTAVLKVIEHCSNTGSKPARVLRGDAQSMPFVDGEFDAVLIDPPYYFSVMYSDLSDFFYVWLKRSVGHLYPEHFNTQWTPKSQEVIQNRCAPSYDGFISEEDFDQRLGNSLSEVTRVVKDDGVVCIVFAHTDVKAWEKLLKALRTAGLTVTTSWPIRSEMQGRPVAHVKAALASSVVLVCRPNRQAGSAFFDEVDTELNHVIGERLEAFSAMGLHGADYFVAAIGPAFEVFAQYKSVMRLSGEEVSISELMELARKAVAKHAMGRILGSERLDRLDDSSLMYLSWRWAYLNVPIPADEAIKLARAFSVDLDLACQPGGFVDRKGKTFELLGPHKRDEFAIRPGSPMVDVLHRLSQLWDSGQPNEVIVLLAESGHAEEPVFWAMAKAIAEILPDGDRERTMIQAFLSSQERITAKAARHHSMVADTMTLFTD